MNWQHPYNGNQKSGPERVVNGGVLLYFQLPPGVPGPGNPSQHADLVKYWPNSPLSGFWYKKSFAGILKAQGRNCHEKFRCSRISSMKMVTSTLEMYSVFFKYFFQFVNRFICIHSNYRGKQSSHESAG